MLATRDFDADDLTAARAFIAAYVRFFHLAEGEEHGHGPGDGQGSHETHGAHHGRH